MAQWMNLQQFCKSDAITFNVLMCEKSGAILLMLVGLMTGWQTGF